MLAHLEESPLGRVAVLSFAIGRERGFGLLALYKDGPVFEAVVVDEDGRQRPQWAAALSRRPLKTRRVSSQRAHGPDWAATIRRIGARLDPVRRPVALAAVVVG